MQPPSSTVSSSQHCCKPMSWHVFGSVKMIVKIQFPFPTQFLLTFKSYSPGPGYPIKFNNIIIAVHGHPSRTILCLQMEKLAMHPYQFSCYSWFYRSFLVIKRDTPASWWIYLEGSWHQSSSLHCDGSLHCIYRSHQEQLLYSLHQEDNTS